MYGAYLLQESIPNTGLVLAASISVFAGGWSLRALSVYTNAMLPCSSMFAG